MPACRTSEPPAEPIAKAAAEAAGEASGAGDTLLPDPSQRTPLALCGDPVAPDPAAPSGPPTTIGEAEVALEGSAGNAKPGDPGDRGVWAEPTEGEADPRMGDAAGTPLCLMKELRRRLRVLEGGACDARQDPSPPALSLRRPRGLPPPPERPSAPWPASGPGRPGTGLATSARAMMRARTGPGAAPWPPAAPPRSSSTVGGILKEGERCLEAGELRPEPDCRPLAAAPLGWGTLRSPSSSDELESSSTRRHSGTSGMPTVAASSGEGGLRRRCGGEGAGRRSVARWLDMLAGAAWRQRAARE